MKTVGNLVKRVMTTSDGAKSISNLYTGRKLNGLVVGGAVALGAASQISSMGSLGESQLTPDLASDVSSILGSQTLMATKRSPAEQAVNPSMLADGRATPGNSKAPTLNATGDLVFGMHNGRKG